MLDPGVGDEMNLVNSVLDIGAGFRKNETHG